jgi:predicted nucleotidyltransferase
MSGTPNAPELTADAAAGDILRQRIRDFLAEKRERGLVSAYLFGSVASGSNHRESDVDLVVLNDFPPRFGRHVVTVGERLLCLDSETDLRFRCQVQLLAADLDVFMRRMEPLKLEALRR